MNDNDQLDDGAVLSAVCKAVSQLPLAVAPGPQVITARGRARRRRRAGLSVAGAGACAALAVGLVAGAPAGPSSQHDASRLTAFSVTSGPDGSTILTISAGELANPSEVRQALAGHDIPALVTVNKSCATIMPSSPDVSWPWNRLPTKSDDFEFQIYGSKIPSRDEITLGFYIGCKPREDVLFIGLANASTKLGGGNFFWLPTAG